MDSIQKITKEIRKFRDERDWMQFHDPKNMAISIVLEASELLEHFQWKSKEEIKKYTKEYKNHIAEEVADVAIYLFELADNLDIDLTKACEKKLKINAEKYPIAKAKGRNTKYNQL